MWRTSPASSNCSRKYTEDSARTDAADTASSSSDRAVMVTSWSTLPNPKRTNCDDKLLLVMSVHRAGAAVCQSSPLTQVTVEKRCRFSPSLLSARNRCLNLIGRRPRLWMRKRYRSRPIGGEEIRKNNRCSQWEQTTRLLDTRPRKADAPWGNHKGRKSL